MKSFHITYTNNKVIVSENKKSVYVQEVNKEKDNLDILLYNAKRFVFKVGEKYNQEVNFTCSSTFDEIPYTIKDNSKRSYNWAVFLDENDEVVMEFLINAKKIKKKAKNLYYREISNDEKLLFRKDYIKDNKTVKWWILIKTDVNHERRFLNACLEE